MVKGLNFICENRNYALDRNGIEYSAIKFTRTEDSISGKKDVNENIFSKSFSFTIWLKFQEEIGEITGNLFDLYDQIKGHRFIFERRKNKIYFCYYAKNDEFLLESYAQKQYDKKWIHVAFTYDSRKKSVISYLDGIKNQNFTWNEKIPEEKKIKNIHFGKDLNNAYFHFSDFMIFNRALEPDEVDTIKNMPSSLAIDNI